MPRTTAPDRSVVLLSPTGKFTVKVTSSRAAALRARGFRDVADAPEPTPMKRPELNARAHELGIPAVGNNAELAAAIAAAEQAD